MRNGDGLRTVLWVAGCNHHCKGCQNPVTWNPHDGLIFDVEAEQELYNKVNKSYISGVTFSGGDPLYPENRDTIFHLAKYIKKYMPDFQMEYEVDPLRQAIAESWPNSLDDTCARQEWGWKPEYDLDAMTKDMLAKLKERFNK